MKNKVDVRMDLEHLVLSMNQAHPLSLIVNEVLTNAFQHAFSELKDNSGKLAIQFYTNDQKVYLFVSDNGKGLNMDKPDATNTLGLKLLETLSRQLRADYMYEANSGGGTHFSITFNRIEPQVREGRSVN